MEVVNMAQEPGMSNTQTPENGASPAAMAAGDGAWRSRLADLLDDVTVAVAPEAEPGAQAAASIAPPASVAATTDGRTNHGWGRPSERTVGR